MTKNTFYSTQDGTKVEGDIDRLYAKIETLFENVTDFIQYNKENVKSLGREILVFVLTF